MFTLRFMICLFFAFSSLSCSDNNVNGDAHIQDTDPDDELEADIHDSDQTVDTTPDGETDADDDSDIPDHALRILTWNLENFPTSTTTVETVAALITEIDADLIAVQEISDIDAFEDLVIALETYDGTVTDDPGAFSWVGLLWRTTRVDAISIETLFETDWYAFPRPPLFAQLDIHDHEGQDVIFDLEVVVLHLKARLDDESRERRRTACERLETWASSRLKNSAEQDILMLGDWNDELTDWGSHQVFQVFLDQPDLYTFLTLDLAEEGGFTYIPFESFLDHLLITADGLDEYGAGTTEVLPLEHSVPNYEINVSDHRPVLSTFVIP